MCFYDAERPIQSFNSNKANMVYRHLVYDREIHPICSPQRACQVVDVEYLWHEVAYSVPVQSGGGLFFSYPFFISI